MRKAAPQDKRCSGRAVGLEVVARCDMTVAVLRAPVVKMWAHCSGYQDDPSYVEFCMISSGVKHVLEKRGVSM